MSIPANLARAALQDTVFVKTASGRAEVATRSAGLKSRQRSVLIMLDGQKCLRELGGFPAQELTEAVAHLLALGLIAPANGVEEDAMPAMPPPDAAAAATKLADIKTLLTNSANTYLGLMAAGVVRRVQSARDEGELLSVVGHWHMAMRDSKYGRDAAETFLEEIRARFGGQAVH